VEFTNCEHPTLSAEKIVRRRHFVDLAAKGDRLSILTGRLSVPRTYPPSSGDHPVLVNEPEQTIASL
jgi:hypothetical protein